mmetsp:Transcript_363/g.1034  ORF Transcript_363/g.1034 Transcript_363/m.1034 type:complete len:241 (+) Transcript_363:388-1110(+)
MHSMCTRLRNGVSPPAPAALDGIVSALENLMRTSYVCLASSRDGQSTRPTGPVPRVSGAFISADAHAMSSGNRNDSVFPEPVNATPIMSRPDRMTGSPCIWIGVGLTMPSSSRRRTSARGSFMAAKESIGGGTSVPSAMIPSSSRISLRSFSVSRLSFSGGLQPVSMAIFPSEICAFPLLSVASSFADMSARFSVTSRSSSSSSLYKRSASVSCACAARMASVCASSDVFDCIFGASDGG